MADAAFALAPRPDLAALRDDFAAAGRVEVCGLLMPTQAEELRGHLTARDDWQLVLNAGERVYELPRAAVRVMTADQKDGLDARVADAARHGFQYRYESIRVPDDPAARNPASPLAAFVSFMSSQPVLELIAAITGIGDLGFADGQATAYGPGDFLTRHDDDVAGKQRRAAYVFGLAPDWRAEWGGLLMFHRADGNIDEAFAPAMGALRLFSVPVAHSVSYVTPFAPEPRLSVTGWLRAGRPDAAQSSV